MNKTAKNQNNIEEFFYCAHCIYFAFSDLYSVPTAFAVWAKETKYIFICIVKWWIHKRFAIDLWVFRKSEVNEENFSPFFSVADDCCEIARRENDAALSDSINRFVNKFKCDKYFNLIFTIAHYYCPFSLFLLYLPIVSNARRLVSRLLLTHFQLAFICFG